MPESNSPPIVGFRNTPIHTELLGAQAFASASVAGNTVASVVPTTPPDHLAYWSESSTFAGRVSGKPSPVFLM
jgi:hypothetical protein